MDFFYLRFHFNREKDWLSTETSIFFDKKFIMYEAQKYENVPKDKKNQIASLLKWSLFKESLRFIEVFSFNCINFE